MSCEVKCLASIPDLPKVQEFLGFSQGKMDFFCGLGICWNVYYFF